MNAYIKLFLSRFTRNLRRHRGLSSSETVDPKSQWTKHALPTTSSSLSSAKKWDSIAEKIRQRGTCERKGQMNLPQLFKMTANVSVLEKCISDKNVSKAYDLLKAVRVEEIDFKFIKLVLLTCSAAADEVTAEKCVEYTRSLNIETTAGIWDALLAVYGESGNYEKAAALLKKMETVYRIKLNTTNFNKTLKAASKGGNFVEATSLVAGMRERNIPQDGVTLSTYIQCAVHSKRLSDARKILDDAMSSIPSARGYEIPPHAFNHIMYGYAEIGSTIAIDSLFKSMLAFNVEPDLYTFSILFSAHGRLENRDALSAYVDIMITRGIRMTHRRPWKALKVYFQKSRDLKLFSEVVQKLHSAGGSENVMPEIVRDYVTILVAAGSSADGFKLLENMTEIYAVTLNVENCKHVIFPQIELYYLQILTRIYYTGEALISSILENGRSADAIRALEVMRKRGTNIPVKLWKKLLLIFTLKKSHFNDKLIDELVGMLLYAHSRDNIFEFSANFNEIWQPIVDHIGTVNGDMLLRLEEHLFLEIVKSYSPDNIPKQFVLEIFTSLLQKRASSDTLKIIERHLSIIDLESLRKILFVLSESTISQTKDNALLCEYFANSVDHLNPYQDSACVAAIICSMIKDRRIERAVEIGRICLLGNKATVENVDKSFLMNYVNALHLLGKTKDLNEFVESFPKEILRDKMNFFEALIRAYVNVEANQDVSNLHKFLWENRSFTDSESICRVYLPVLDNAVLQDNFYSARRLLDQIASYKTAVPEFLLLRYLEALLKKAKYCDAVSWIETRFVPSNSIDAWMMVIKECCSMLQVDYALMCMDRMRRSGDNLRPTSVCWTLCINAFIASHR